MKKKILFTFGAGTQFFLQFRQNMVVAMANLSNTVNNYHDAKPMATLLFRNLRNHPYANRDAGIISSAILFFGIFPSLLALQTGPFLSIFSPENLADQINQAGRIYI